MWLDAIIMTNEYTKKINNNYIEKYISDICDFWMVRLCHKKYIVRTPKISK